MSNGLRSLEHSLNKENTSSNFTKKRSDLGLLNFSVWKKLSWKKWYAKYIATKASFIYSIPLIFTRFTKWANCYKKYWIHKTPKTLPNRQNNTTPITWSLEVYIIPDLFICTELSTHGWWQSTKSSALEDVQ